MRTNILILIIFGFLFTWLGFSFYMNVLDAALFPPITFLADQQNLKTDKTEYHAGEFISIQNSFCKNRNYAAKTTWRILNGTVITFPDQGSHVSKTECVTDRWFTIGQIPVYAAVGMHHLEGTTEVQVNSQKKIYLNFKSQEFNVIQ